MKKQFLIILSILLILTNCNYEFTNRIEGNWIGLKQTIVFDKDTIVENFHLILSIDKDSISTRNFKLIDSRDSLSKSSYLLIDSILIISQNTKSTDSLKIDFLNNNLIELSIPNTKYTFARLVDPPPKPQTINLAGNIYTISDSIQVIDTIEFMENKSLLIYNLYSIPTLLNEWRVKQYLGFSFLIIDNPEIPVFFVQKTAGKIELKREPESNIGWVLKKIKKEKKFKRSELIGKWTGKSNRPDIELNFIFDFDSVQMNEFTGGEMVTAKYSLNLNGTKMFCFHKYASGNIFYEIENIRNDSLYLKRLTPIEDSFVLTKVK